MQLNWTDLKSLDSEGVSTISEVGGIYRLSYLNPTDGKLYVYYVGQAANLNSRLGEHQRGQEVNVQCHKYLNGYECYFRAAGVHKDYRDGAEAALYNHFKPECCERIPNTIPIEININN